MSCETSKPVFIQGRNGQNGTSAYMYVAYADLVVSNVVTNFSLTPTSTTNWVGFKSSDTILIPIEADFVDTWVNISKTNIYKTLTVSAAQVYSIPDEELGFTFCITGVGSHSSIFYTTAIKTGSTNTFNKNGTLYLNLTGGGVNDIVNWFDCTYWLTYNYIVSLENKYAGYKINNMCDLMLTYLLNTITAYGSLNGCFNITIDTGAVLSLIGPQYFNSNSYITLERSASLELPGDSDKSFIKIGEGLSVCVGDDSTYTYNSIGGELQSCGVSSFVVTATINGSDIPTLPVINSLPGVSPRIIKLIGTNSNKTLSGTIGLGGNIGAEQLTLYKLEISENRPAGCQFTIPAAANFIAPSTITLPLVLATKHSYIEGYMSNAAGELGKFIITDAKIY